jgi:hypothetical protein
MKRLLRAALAVLLIYTVAHEVIAPASGGEYPKRIYTGELPPAVSELRAGAGAPDARAR